MSVLGIRALRFMVDMMTAFLTFLFFCFVFFFLVPKPLELWKTLITVSLIALVQKQCVCKNFPPLCPTYLVFPNGTVYQTAVTHTVKQLKPLT